MLPFERHLTLVLLLLVIALIGWIAVVVMEIPLPFLEAIEL
ncbi:MAG: hypothetical protein V3W04_03210 [Gammaproteobacteria bacterium]